MVAQQVERIEDAVRCYRTAVQYNCADAECYGRLVALLEERGADPAESDRLLVQVTQNHPSPDAHRVRADWLLKHQRADDAAAELWNGLQLDPDDLRLNSRLISVMHSSSSAASSEHQPAQQKLTQHLQDGVTRSPGDWRLRLLCAHAQWQFGDRAPAISTLKDGIARNPQAFELQEVLIDYLVSEGDSEQATQAFSRMPRAALDHARWHFLEGRVHMAAHQWQQAAASFDRAVGFAEADQRIRYRSGMCLAECRRALGDRDDALETYRAMIHAQPASQDSRLGMAATWLEAGRTDLAIAEYRQLQDVAGVPELLASLLIQETLRLPASRRSWREVETLLRDADPAITDATQRTLLRADLLFAQGHPAQALRLLDDAVLQQPGNSAFLSSRRRVLTDSEELLRTKMANTLTRHPASPEAHVTLLRLAVHQHGPEAAAAVLQELTDGPVSQSLTLSRRLLTAAEVAERAALDFQRFRNANAASAMLEQSEQAWRRLVSESAEFIPQAVAFCARHHHSEDVLTTLRRWTGDIDVRLQAQSWLTALTHSSQKQLLKGPVEQVLRQCVIQDPADLRLRQIYAEYLLQFAEYDDALTLERQILQQDPRNTVALCRVAWILTMSGGDHSEALKLSENASRVAPASSEVRITRALVLTHSESPDDALPVFRSLPDEARSGESLAYEALALLRSGRAEEAATAAKNVQRLYVTDRWRPADRRLLKEILSQPGQGGHCRPLMVLRRIC